MYIYSKLFVDVFDRMDYDFVYYVNMLKITTYIHIYYHLNFELYITSRVNHEKDDMHQIVLSKKCH